MQTPLAVSEDSDPRPGPAEVLRYPARSLILLGGIPGAGKSTLLNRLYGLTGEETSTVVAAEGVRIIDSQQSRNRLTPWLRLLPYPSWRWVVHLAHYMSLVLALRHGGPVIVHEPATRPFVRALVSACCRAARIQLHLLFIDVDPAEARIGQIARGRMVSSRSFRAHEVRWRRLLAACSGDPARGIPGAVSLVVLDRARARVVRAIHFRHVPVPAVRWRAARAFTYGALLLAAL
ncbi:AAA family ATPase [Marinactinospora thermotolerans]|uniref:ATPase components of ABC transporters with duplicated ATPase domains n=1 Tax=Marinactinospora thermotolerans DSM 45154 TaxID=1122192 RepID=A0A1T4M8Q8_9ACTN|nr:AAA family ATPase [Marinactinospora thermotolerans]SJZ63217.1 ATPase components of ABC transporters with duplicated ATPase domains [Marinactinospora thermotolerans DSM 45154]